MQQRVQKLIKVKVAGNIFYMTKLSPFCILAQSGGVLSDNWPLTSKGNCLRKGKDPG